MPRVTKELKAEIKSLSKEELEAIVIKFASKQEIFDYIMVHILNPETGEIDLFEYAKKEIANISNTQHIKGTIQTHLYYELKKCCKVISHFKSISKNKHYEADLLMETLSIPFTNKSNIFGSRIRKFDNKVNQLIQRTIALVTKHLDSDYHIEYIPTLDEYINRAKFK